MRIVLALLLALVAGGVMAHSAVPAANGVVQVKAIPTTLMQALQADSAKTGCAAQHKLSLLDAGDPPSVGGPVYCAKMLYCCDNGNASCCALFERYCNPD